MAPLSLELVTFCSARSRLRPRLAREQDLGDANTLDVVTRAAQAVRPGKPRAARPSLLRRKRSASSRR